MREKSHPGRARFLARALLTACAGLASASVGAGGLYLQEFADVAMGTASAGATALGLDASTALHNPAGMTRLDGTHLSGGFGAAFAEVRFDPSPATPTAGSDGGNAGGFGPLMRGSLVHSFSDRVKLGFNVTSISGSVLDYDDDWVGRFQAQQVKLFTLSMIPTLGIKVTDKLSLGVGAMIMYGQLDYRLAFPIPGPSSAEGSATISRATDWDGAVMLSGLFEPSERTRIGISYQSEIEMNLKGTLSVEPVNPAVEINTGLPFVQRIRGDVYHELNDRWAIMAGGRWEEWSRFDDQWFTTDSTAIDLERNWDDTWGVSAGVHYRPRPRLLLQLGGGYDSNPVSSTNRTADLPIDRQWRIAGGVRYDADPHTTVGAAITYMDMGDAKINNAQLVGEYDENRVLFIGGYFNKRF